MKLLRHKNFIKDFKKLKLTDSQFEKLIKYLHLLQEEVKLPFEAKDHELLGKWKNFRKFHVGGDLIVIYYVNKDEIILTRMGTHSQLFE